MRPEWIENGRRCFDHIAAGSTWCANLLLEAGLPSVSTVIQGIDPFLFYPATGPENGRQFLADRFAVFSGGKFEFRKGQDIVIRAYKVLQDRHADVMLVNAWHNPWPASMATMQSSPLIRFESRDERYFQAINRVLADNGIDLKRVITVPAYPHFALGRLYRDTDVGLFPNRCEGGTNLVLMEYMACGRPVIAVNTTGHADIINSSNALLIGTKGEHTVEDGRGVALARWPEPDLDDVIDQLEWAYLNRTKLRDLGQQAGKGLASFTWRNTAETLQKVLRERSCPATEVRNLGL